MPLPLFYGGNLACRACKQPHPPTMRCERWAAINGRLTSNERLTPAINSDDDAINKQDADSGDGSGVQVRGEEMSAAYPEVGKADARSPNRRTREAYNAYMRAYMRKRRA